MTTVVLLAHGSPDPRAARAAGSLATGVRRRHRDLRVHCAYLSHGPTLAEVSERLGSTGTRTAVVVPAFLSTGQHLSIDVPTAVQQARRRTPVDLVVGEPLGLDTAMLAAVDRALPPLPVVAAVAGTNDPYARAEILDVTRAWAGRRDTPVLVAHASRGRSSVRQAIETLERATGERAAVAALVLFPGVLPDRIADAAGGRPCTAPLSTLPETVDTLAARARAARAAAA